MQLYICLTFLFILSAQAVPTDRIREINAHLVECVKEIDVTTQTLQELHEDKIPEGQDYEKLKKWSLCFLKKSGFIDEAGTLHTEVIRDALKEDEVGEGVLEKMISSCRVQKSTPEESSFYYLKCVFKILKDARKTK